MEEITQELADEDQRDALLITVFLGGIDSRIRQSLVTHGCDTLKDLVKLARAAEAALNETTKREAEKTAADNVRAIQSQQQQMPRYYDSQHNHDRALPPHNPEPYFFQGQQASRQQPQMPFFRAPPVCFNCNERGHFQRSCTRPRRYQHARNEPNRDFNYNAYPRRDNQDWQKN